MSGLIEHTESKIIAPSGLFENEVGPGLRFFNTVCALVSVKQEARSFSQLVDQRFISVSSSVVKSVQTVYFSPSSVAWLTMMRTKWKKIKKIQVWMPIHLVSCQEFPGICHIYRPSDYNNDLVVEVISLV